MWTLNRFRTSLHADKPLPDRTPRQQTVAAQRAPQNCVRNMPNAARNCDTSLWER